MNEIMKIVTACTRPVQAQAKQNPSNEEWHKVLPLREELLKKLLGDGGSAFFKGMVPSKATYFLIR